MSMQLLEAMPLRDRVREAEQLVRELADHLERGFLPKIHEVRRLTRHTGLDAAETTKDSTIRSTVDAALSSHEYSLELVRKLDRFLMSIDREFQHLVSNTQPEEPGRKAT
jgi:hypothetical protein